MQVLTVRNVHEALPKAIDILSQDGVVRSSRDGDVLVLPTPMTTVYMYPSERVLFWPERDANPFFHLAEALWMLQGRNDLAFPQHYVKTFDRFSDDGVTIHGAYGHRWRGKFGVDQLAVIARRLREDPTDRRCVLQMWSSAYDLDRTGVDVPCNTTATFQIGPSGTLNMTVFCRSNDIIWGAYGANAVHFSVLQEYMAMWIGVPIGIYEQVSVNWHAYTKVINGLLLNCWHGKLDQALDPYVSGDVHFTPLSIETGQGAISEWDNQSARLIDNLGRGVDLSAGFGDEGSWWSVVTAVLYAYEVYKKLDPPDRYTEALGVLSHVDQKNDWVVAARQWLTRRQDKWEMKSWRSMQKSERAGSNTTT